MSPTNHQHVTNIPSYSGSSTQVYIPQDLTIPQEMLRTELKLKDFGMMKKFNKWLGEIGRGMTWGKHMVAAVDELRAELGPPLFALGEA